MKKLFNATLIFKHFDCVTRLSLTKKFVDHRSWLRKCDNFPASFTAQVRLGYLDVAMQKKNCETCMPSCAIDSQQRLFRCSHRKNFFGKFAKKFKNLSVKLMEISCKNIWSVNVGVHHFDWPFITFCWSLDFPPKNTNPRIAEIFRWATYTYHRQSFFKWANPGLFLFIFVFSTLYNSINWWKHWWCAWDLNPRQQDGRHRQIHWAMAAPQGNLSYSSLPHSWLA